MEWSEVQNQKAQDLSWYDWSIAKDVSRDRQWVLFEEASEPAGKNYAVAIRKVDGSPPIRLGEGTVGGLSPDGKWALSVFIGKPQHVSLYPIGPGQPRQITLPNLDHLENGSARFMPDGRHFIVDGTEPGKAARTYLVDIDGTEPPRPVSPENTEAGLPSPDGKYVVGNGALQSDGSRKLSLFPLDGSAPIELATSNPSYTVMQWSQDGKALYLYKYGDMPTTIFRLDIASGKITPIRDVTPAERAGVVSVGPVMCDPTATGCAYSYYQTLSVMYVVTGLQ